VVLALLSLAPLPLQALPYGSLDWVDYDPAYRQGCSWPVPPPQTSGKQIVCGEQPAAAPHIPGRQTASSGAQAPPPPEPAADAPQAELPVLVPEAPALQIPCAEMPGGDEPLAAIVSGQEIGRAAFDREMEQFLLALQAAGADVAGLDIQASLPEFRRQVLELLIEDVLIQQAAVEASISVSEESLEARIAAQVADGGGLELFQAWLAQTGQTWQEIRRDTCQELLAAQLQAAVTGRAPQPVEMVQARLIVVPSQEDAVRVLARLASGEPFDQVAREVSIDDATREQGGELGWFFRGQGVVEAQVEALAFAGRQGEVQGPVEASEGYALVQTIRPVTLRIPDAEGQAALRAAAFQRWLEERRQAADVQVLADFLLP
jgi:parvulin-like peptidyl-prolyl isomerase